MSDWNSTGVRTTDKAPAERQGVPERVRVLVIAGPDQGGELEIGAEPIRIGKSPECDLALTDSRISRHHLQLRVTDGGVIAVDLGSLNGSFYQGARFTEVTLGLGALITIGSTELRLSAIGSRPEIASSARTELGELVGQSLAMRQLFALMERVAVADSPVLIEGETGTGKELCAMALHAEGARAGRPFVICDLAGIARPLLESDLFGHVRGAFTGADRGRAGAFEQAHGGTLFLDEVGELEKEMQPRLLRAIAQQSVKPVGGSRYRTVDVRIIAATNRDLREEVRAGTFREDLFYRLSVVSLRLPPLRERREDIPLLVERLLRGRAIEVPEESLMLLAEYDWPGNVRQLQNVLDAAVSRAGGERRLTPALLGLSAERAGGGGAPAQPGDEGDRGFREAKERLVAAWERDYLVRLLKRNEGNVTQAARASGIDRVYLYRLLKKHGISDWQR
ncbi:MAG: polymerase sigma factor 54 [Myxococcales bacterium]|nr:polymerase sigma factor 54 [Myxococcales bacterium]